VNFTKPFTTLEIDIHSSKNTFSCKTWFCHYGDYELFSVFLGVKLCTLPEKYRQTFLWDVPLPSSGSERNPYKQVNWTRRRVMPDGVVTHRSTLRLSDKYKIYQQPPRNSWANPNTNTHEMPLPLFQEAVPLIAGSVTCPNIGRGPMYMLPTTMSKEIVIF
jgi:hypothetical protein